MSADVLEITVETAHYLIFAIPQRNLVIFADKWGAQTRHFTVEEFCTMLDRVAAFKRAAKNPCAGPGGKAE